MTRLSESAVLAGEILRKWSAVSRPETGLEPFRVIPDTREQERLEALEAVLQEMRRDEAGPDQAAACRYLMRHLSMLPPSVS